MDLSFFRPTGVACLVWSPLCAPTFLRHKCIYQNLSDDTPCQKKLLLYVYFQYDRSGRSLGVAYVQFSNPKDAKAAVDRLNGVPAKGEPRLQLCGV